MNIKLTFKSNQIAVDSLEHKSRSLFVAKFSKSSQQNWSVFCLAFITFYH